MRRITVKIKIKCPCGRRFTLRKGQTRRCSCGRIYRA